MPDQVQRLTHLLVRGRSEDRAFNRQGGGDPRIRNVERRAHGQAIQSQASEALAQQDRDREELSLDELEALGVVLTIVGTPGFPLKLESFDRLTTHRTDPRAQWLLLNVSPETDETPERALVWVSDEYRPRFLRLIEEYLARDRPSGQPWNRWLISNVSRIRAATLEDLWQSDGPPPTSGHRWWEVWLRPTSDAVELARDYARRFQLDMASSHLRFDSRHVVWLRASWDQLLAMPFSAVPVSELRRPQFVETVEDLDLGEQEQLVEDLALRLTPAESGAPAVCLLDTGVRRTHMLIEPSLSDSDVHSVVGLPAGDVMGHGTQMAGLALLGPLDGPLLDNSTIRLRHRLESVKLLPDANGSPHDPEAYGVVTAQAVALPEIVADRRRVFCLTATSDPDRPGEPSLWSAAVDALAAGTDIGRSAEGIELLGPPEADRARLIVVSAGNVDEPYEDAYRNKCDLSPIEDPAQAWNTLTVGAHTDLVDPPTHPSYAGWRVVASEGDISPHSRTGVIAGGAQWPIKPDICMEGGNVVTDGAGDFHHKHPVLSLRTTDVRSDAALSSANATSAATAQASRLAALAMSTYPSYWPETIRGLLTHSAEWTPTMRSEILAETAKKQRVLLIKRYGWGVPTENAVLSSARNAVTMVVQDQFVPFTGRDYQMRSFRLHQLPWPVDVLTDLGPHDVELRVTLSYFIEPSAARRGWRRRYAYASHGLRFELRGPNETTPEFVRRVNREANVEEDGVRRPASPSGNWTVGPDQRNKGSLHQDVWVGDGPQLASTGGVLGVHPVGGWWKNNRRKDRIDLPIRYALLISLRTRATDVDLYTPIAASLEIPVEAIAIET